MALPVPSAPQVTRVSGGVANITKQNNTMQIKTGDGALWVQNGGVFDERGVPVPFEEIPGWFWEEWKKVSKEMKAIHGDLEAPKEELGAGPVPEPTDEEADKAELVAMLKDDLIEVAKAEGVDVASGDTKEVIADKIIAARAE